MATNPVQITMCPEARNILPLKQSHRTNCVPTAMRIILAAQNKKTTVPDADPHGVNENDSAALAMLAGFKISDASEHQQNVIRAANHYRSILQKSSFVAIRSFPHGGSATLHAISTTPSSYTGSRRSSARSPCSTSTPRTARRTGPISVNLPRQSRST